MVTTDAIPLALSVTSGSLGVVVRLAAIMLLRPIDATMAEGARVQRTWGTFTAPKAPPLPATCELATPVLLALRHVPELPQH